MEATAEELDLPHEERWDRVPRVAHGIFTQFPGSTRVFLRGRNVRAALSRLAITYQEVVEFDLNPHRQCQSLVEREARPWHQDVLAWVGQHCQGKLYGLAAAAC